MWLYLLAVALPSFVFGFAVCQHLYTKKIDSIMKNLPSEAELSSKRYLIFLEGWNAANSDKNNVKMQYDKLVNPLKYAPRED